VFEGLLFLPDTVQISLVLLHRTCIYDSSWGSGHCNRYNATMQYVQQKSYTSMRIICDLLKLFVTR